MSTYSQYVNLKGNDSPTISTPPSDKVAASEGFGSSKKPHAGIKQPRGVKPPSKKPMKQPKSSFTDTIEHITTTIKAIQQTLANLPPVQLPQFVEPNAALRQRLEAINIGTEYRILIDEYHAHSDNEGVRSFLSCSHDKTLDTWVYQFICKHKDQHQLLVPGSTCFWVFFGLLLLLMAGMCELW